jgi:hypothetical protein
MPKPQSRRDKNVVTIADWEQLYRITFTDYERGLLNTSDPLLIGEMDGQHRFLLRMALTPLRCPACPGIICQRSAGWQTEEVSHPDNAYECPFCHAQLTWGLGLAGDQWFTLTPGQTITIGGEVPPSE